MKCFKAVIVDDERLAREDLKSMLGRHPIIDIVGEAGSAKQAADVIRTSDPDVIFLDIHMPGESGFDLMEKIETRARIIFVTAYDEYAIRAFNVNALDYLLKPVEPERLARSLERLAGAGTGAAAAAKRLLCSDSLYVKAGNKAAFLRVDRIICIVAADDYAEVHVDGGENRLVSKSMNEWERQLPEKNFRRIHRSVIVNVDKVDHIVDRPNATSSVFMKGLDGSLPMSRRRKSLLRGNNI